MGNYTPAMLEYWLKDILSWSHLGTSQLTYDGGIRLLDPDTPLESRYLYVGDVESIASALNSGTIPPEGVCMISAGDSECLKNCQLPDNVTLLVTTLPLIALYNHVQYHVHWFHEWDADMHEVVFKNGGLQQLLEHAYLGIHATILLLNTGYKHIASVYSSEVQDPTADEMKANGYHKFETIQSIQQESAVRHSRSPEFVEYISSISNNYTIVYLIRYKNTLVARLVIILNGPAPNYCYSDMAASLARYVAEYMFSSQGVDYSTNADFGILATDLIECRLTDPEELEERLRQIHLTVQSYYHVMLVSFDHARDRENIPWNYVISQLEYIFPFSDITTYKGDILLIFQKTKHGKQYGFDLKQLNAVLEHYDAYAAISNTSEFLTSLPPLYHQTKAALRLGRVIHPQYRTYFYEDYSIYQIIELAAEAAKQNLGSRNLAHLCNNETISLIRYDKKKGTNLTNVAYAYLSHERNTSEAAKSLFMHRNTMLYKIHKIEEVIGTSLDNPLLRERMMFSFHVLEYMQKYLKEDILVLKRPQIKDSSDNLK